MKCSPKAGTGPGKLRQMKDELFERIEVIVEALFCKNSCKVRRLLVVQQLESSGVVNENKLEYGQAGRGGLSVTVWLKGLCQGEVVAVTPWPGAQTSCWRGNFNENRCYATA